jgi:hypothetical protein
MNDEDLNGDDLKEKLKLMREEPSAALLERILTVVPNMAQVSPGEPASGFSFLRFFGEFRYGLAVKFAAISVVAVMGFCVGHLNGPSMHQDSKIMATMLTGDIGLEDQYAESGFVF